MEPVLFKPARFRRITGTLSHLLLALAALAAVILLVPVRGRMPGTSLDDSWVYALNHALAERIEFGRELVFTLGPLAPVFTKSFHPATWAFAIGWATVLAGCYVALLFYVSRVRPLLGPSLFVLVAAFISNDWNASFMAFPILAAGALCTSLSSPVRPKWLAELPLAIAVTLGSAILLLMKGSFLPACLVTVGVWTGVAILRRRVALAVALPLLLSFFTLALWLWSRQPLASLPDYLLNSLPIISGYTEAMSAGGPALEFIVYLLVAGVIVLVLVPTSFGSEQWPRWAYLACIACALLLAFKAGFVRHDDHALTAAYVLLIAALVSSPWRARGPAALAPAFALAGSLYIASGHSNVMPRELGNRLVRWASDGLGDLVRLPGSQARLNAAYEKAMTAIADRSPIPYGDGRPADIYSYKQTDLIAQGWNWRPRPVFQSYSVYTPSLNEMNRDFLLSDRAPQTIFYASQPIDNRYAAQEDSLSLPVLLSLYRPIRRLPDGFLELERELEGNQTPPSLKPISHAAVRLGQTVPVPPSREGLAVFVRATLRKSLVGSLKAIVFKPAELRLEVRMQDGQLHNSRLIAQIAASGFVLSPDVTGSTALLSAFAGRTSPATTPVSFRIVPASGSRDWNDRYDAEVFVFPLPIRHEVQELLSDPQVDPRDFWRVVTPADNCAATIDLINGMAATATEVHLTADTVNIDGWGAVALEQGIAAEAFVVQLRDSAGRTTRLETSMSPRDDVKRHLGKAGMGDIGYHARATGLAPGSYDIEVYRRYRGSYGRCDFPRPRLILEATK